MFNEPRARVTRRRPAIAKSYEVGDERAHMYRILAATVGDDVPIERSQNPVKSLANSHVTEKANASYKISKSCQEKKLLVLVFLFYFRQCYLSLELNQAKLSFLI